MKKKIFVGIVLFYLLIVLLLRPGYYFTSCECGYSFHFGEPGMDCMVMCGDAAEDITSVRKVVNIFLLNF